jgi:CubicO group peptidase (beta-lactamase class C family)
MERDYWPTKLWRTAAPAALEVNEEKLAGLDNMIKSGYGNINGFVVVHKGQIIFERYYHGYGTEDTHHVASVTKSIISALIGVAINAGDIKSVEEKVLDYFPEYSANAPNMKRAVTIRHLLTMTAPFPFSWKTGGRGGQEPLDRLRRQRDWVKYTLDLLGQKGQPGQFQYFTAGTHLLSAIITRVTGKCAREYANEHLFRPLGMNEIPDHQSNSFGLDDVFGKNVTGWVKDPDGNTAGGWGLTLTPRDMVRFGFLYLNDGFWENTLVITREWVDHSTAMNANQYGYLWWLREEGGVFSFSALGSGGNVICCVPKKDLVVAIASKIISKPQDRWLLIEKCIIPVLGD